MTEFRKFQYYKNITLFKSAVIREDWRMESAVIVFKNDIGNKPKLETNKFFFSI